MRDNRLVSSRLGGVKAGRKRCAMVWVCVLATVVQTPFAVYSFVLPASRLTLPLRSRESRCFNCVARQGPRRAATVTRSTKIPSLDDPASDKSAAAKTTSSSNGGRGSNGGGGAGAQQPRRSSSYSGASSTLTSTKREGSRDDPGVKPTEGPEAADMHVLVPVQDVVSATLTGISQAAADSLGGGEVVHVSMERFCKTLESIFRTEFSVKVDRANASSVLGGRRDGTPAPAVSGSSGQALQRPEWSPKGEGVLEESSSSGGGDRGLVASAAGKTSSFADNKAKQGRWRRGFLPERRRQGDGVETAEIASSTAAKGVRHERRGGGGRSRSDGDDCEDEEMVPLLQLVEELVQTAMFSPISDRDVMMSQALAAEFPTAARVRPVFGNLANVYRLLHPRPKQDSEVGDSRNKEARREDEYVPFEGRLLVFRRGNGVEETKGRLLLKKLDYLQSNAVGWLSQSVTDTIKGGQEQVVAVVDACARGIARRKNSLVNSCVEGAVSFGLERDNLARFITAANGTDIAANEQDVLDEALGTLRRSARRGPVNLQRYGLRQVNVKLEEFSEGGAWPPGDDSWFWGTRNDEGAGERNDGSGSLETENRVPSAVLPRVTLASVLSGGAVPRRGGKGETAATKARLRPDIEGESRSVLSRLLSRCTIKEPTYDEVVVVYIKRPRQSLFRTPPVLVALFNIGTRLRNRIRGVEQTASEPEGVDEVKSAGLGLQLRVYRGVPLVSLNAIAPDKKVEVRPQTALRLDLNSLLGLGLVLANLRFDSPVLVVAATASLVLLVVRTVVGYLNARTRVESFVSRDILDKTMGSNVPVLRHLAEEAAQQKARHIALVYAALLQCAVMDTPDPGGSEEWGSLTAVSMAAVSRHCDAMIKACVGLPWEARVDVPHWLKELESLKLLVRVDAARERSEGLTNDETNPQLLRLSLEGLDCTSTSATTTGTPSSATIACDQGQTAESSAGCSTIVYYRLLDPEAAVEELKVRWSELVEPPPRASRDRNGRTNAMGSGPSAEIVPWARRPSIDKS